MDRRIQRAGHGRLGGAVCGAHGWDTWNLVANFMGSPPMNLLRHAPGTPAGPILGLRPEHLPLTPGEGWSLQADTVELLGAERLEHVRLDEAVASPVPGQHFSASPRPDCVHYFDLHTGLRLP